MPNAFYIKRKDVFLGRELKFGETGNLKLVRLVKKGKGLWKRPVHEYLEVSGKIEELNSPLEHFSHNNIASFVKKLNFYTSINAEYLYKNREKASFFSIFFYPVGKFLKNYFWKLGFLDGAHGFIHAVLMSFHSFLTRAKLFFLTNKKQ